MLVDAIIAAYRAEVERLRTILRWTQDTSARKNLEEAIVDLEDEAAFLETFEEG